MIKYILTTLMIFGTISANAAGSAKATEAGTKRQEVNKADANSEIRNKEMTAEKRMNLIQSKLETKELAGQFDYARKYLIDKLAGNSSTDSFLVAIIDATHFGETEIAKLTEAEQKGLQKMLAIVNTKVRAEIMKNGRNSKLTAAQVKEIELSAVKELQASDVLTKEAKDMSPEDLLKKLIECLIGKKA